MGVGRGLTGCWRPNKYVRLDRCEPRPRSRVEATPRRRFWRIKISLRIRSLRPRSPKGYLRRLRDAYVRLMMRFANSNVLGDREAGAREGFGHPRMKEYDDKMIMEVYKSLQGQMIGCV